MENRIENLIKSIERLRSLHVTREDLTEVKNNINLIFDGKKCNNFVYTVNTDKLPFGIVAIPSSANVSSWISPLITGNILPTINEYDVEIDSKMFDYGLTNEEVACVILYNIYHLTNGFYPLNKVRECIDIYLANSQTSLIEKPSVQYASIIELGAIDTLNQVTSCLYLPDDVQNDPFLDSVGLENYFTSAIDKLYQRIPDCDNEVTRLPKLSMLEWSLRLYQNVSTERLPAIHMLETTKDITASVLYISRMNVVITALNRIDTTIYESTDFEELTEKVRLKDAEDIEEDLVEIKARCNNIETSDDVAYALKKINTNIATLTRYISQNPGDEASRWVNVRDQYFNFRDILMNNTGMRNDTIPQSIDELN